MLKKEAVNEDLINLVEKLQEKDYLNDFILVGGTGLALQIGHRRSIDINLFCKIDFDVNSVLENLEKDFSFSLDFQDKNTIKGSINGIKVDLISHNYKYLKEPLEIDNLEIASLEDITAMKLNAVSNDGSRVKDFIDLYYLLDLFEMEAVLSFYQHKYELRSSLNVLKSLNYFNDVNLDEWPVLIADKDLKWKDVKDRIDRSCKQYIHRLKD
jgi:Nucleotidyl transferase AbiEii toxin, Type IV TA system